MRRSFPRPGPLPTTVALRLDAVQRVLQRTDQNLAPLVVGHLGLLDQRDGRREGFDRTRVLSGRGIRDGSVRRGGRKTIISYKTRVRMAETWLPCNSGTADGAVPRHYLLELGLTKLGRYAVLGERTTRRFTAWSGPRSTRGRSTLGIKVGRGTLARGRAMRARGSTVGMTAGVAALVEEGRIHVRSRTLSGATHRWASVGTTLHVARWSLSRSGWARWEAT